MSLVPAKCPECGGNVVVDNEKDAWVCDFCKSPFIVDKAIQNFNTVYNTTNVTNITNQNEIKAEVVNVYDNSAKDFVIKAGELMEYNGESMDVVIPNNVVVIGLEAFRDSLIHSVSVPDTVIRIKDRAFAGCVALERVMLPQKYEGDLPSFAGCTKLKTITVPEGVRGIGVAQGIDKFDLDSNGEGFNDCVSLEEVLLPKSLEYIGRCAFRNCSSLIRVVLPDGVSRIYDNAFEGCSCLEEIVIPDSVKNIGENAFSGCVSLKRVVVNPENDYNIAESAFSGVPNGGGKSIGIIMNRQREEEREKSKRQEQKAYLDLCEHIEGYIHDCYTRRICTCCNKELTLFGNCKNRVGALFVGTVHICPNDGRKIFASKDKVYDGVTVRTSITAYKLENGRWKETMGY